jgi:SAM-dependent methyltransferase
MRTDVKAGWQHQYANDWVTKVLPRLVYAPALIEPELAKLLGDVQHRRILDAGCGEGQYSRSLKALGARMVGIDGSDTMIRVARERDAGHDIPFDVADLMQPLAFPDQCFDAIISAGVLMSLPALDTFLAESLRVLKPGGVLAVSVNHPAFSNPTMMMYHPRWRRWLRKPLVGIAFNYYSGGGRIVGNGWPFYHRTIEQYVDGFRDSGFFVDRITEPHQLSQDILARHNVEYVTRLPRYIFFKLVKP